MDNLTHTMVGLVLSRAGLGRGCARPTLLLLLAANAPEIDILARLGGNLAYLEHHRGLSHSLIALPFVALLPLLALVPRRRAPARWMRAYVASLVAVVIHAGLDLTNSYGVRLLEPFSSRWFQLEMTHIVDLWISAILIGTLLVILLSRLVGAEIGAPKPTGQGIALTALILVGVFYFGRYLAHERAVAVLDAHLYAGRLPLRVAAFPTFANPFRWRGIVETENAHLVYDLNLRQSFNTESARTLFKPEATPLIDAARQEPEVAAFLRFAQYPAWRILPADDPGKGPRVEVSDLRFGLPGDGRFTATAQMDTRGRVIDARFDFQSTAGSGTR